MAANGKRPVTQIALARKGVITPEMDRVAEREELPAEFIRDELARWLPIIKATGFKME